LRLFAAISGLRIVIEDVKAGINNFKHKGHFIGMLDLDRNADKKST
jgi:hypothetical protein